jgi:membrane dipeptidase
MQLHRDAVVADLHIDPLLWNRDLRTGSKRGDVDLPRLEAGGVDVPVFGIVTAGLPIIGGFRLFTWWYDWKPGARRTPWAAALDQLARLDALVAGSDGKMMLARSADDVEAALEGGRMAAMIGVEGAHAIDGDVSRVRTLHERGVLYMGPVHLSANELGGASFPVGHRGGLTDYGRRVVAEMERVGMFIDTAHLSEAAFWEVVRTTKGPILCSHTGIYGVEPSWRNLKDDQLKAIADRGGVIGIMLATNFMGGKSVRRWVDHVKHAVAVAGIDHVALGSDFDGFIPVPTDCPDISYLPRLTAALLEAGFSPEEARKIMGGNFVAMLHRFRPHTVP